MGLVRYILTTLTSLCLVFFSVGQVSDELKINSPQVSLEVYFKKSDKELSNTIYRGHTRIFYSDSLSRGFENLLSDNKIDSILTRGIIPIDFQPTGFLQTRLDEIAIAVLKFRSKPKESCINKSYSLKHDRIRIFAAGIEEPITINNSTKRKTTTDSLLIGFREYLYDGIPQKKYSYYFEEDCENKNGKEVTFFIADFRFITAIEFQNRYMFDSKND